MAADLALWCLQGRSERRPQSMEQVLAHRFFNPEGELHHFASMSEPMDAFVRRQATLVHSCVYVKNGAERVGYMRVSQLHSQCTVAKRMATTISQLSGQRT